MTTSSHAQCTWKPTTGGILSIIAGAINLFMGIILASVSRYDMWEYPGMVLGIPALIFISMSKDEFDQPTSGSMSASPPVS